MRSKTKFSWGLSPRVACSGSKMTETRSDAYGYNDRSELTNAVKNATVNFGGPANLRSIDGFV